MGRARRFLVAALLVLALLVLFGSWRAEHRVPRHAGKTLYEWISEYERTKQAIYGGGVGAADFDRSMQALEDAPKAIRHIGTNALPFLMADIRAEFTLKDKVVAWLGRVPFLKLPVATAPTRWIRAIRGLEVLGPIAKPCLPELTAIATNNVGCGPAALLAVGPDALPAVTNLLAHPRYGLRGNLIGALVNAVFAERVKPEEAAMAVPALLAAFHSTDTHAQGCAAGALGAIHQELECGSG